MTQSSSKPKVKPSLIGRQYDLDLRARDMGSLYVKHMYSDILKSVHTGESFSPDTKN